MTEATDKGERYYQGAHGVPVPWLQQYEKRPDPPKPEREPLKVRLSRTIKLGMVSTADVWRSSFVKKGSKNNDRDY